MTPNEADKRALAQIRKPGKWRLHRDEHGFPDAITRNTYVVINLNASQRTEACIDEFMRNLNGKPSKQDDRPIHTRE